MVISDAIPTKLKTLPHWVTWRRETRDGRVTKVPYMPQENRRASSTDPATWSSFEAALADCEKGRADGVGFVFTNSPYTGVDLDHCLEDGYLTRDSGQLHRDQPRWGWPSHHCPGRSPTWTAAEG